MNSQKAGRFIFARSPVTAILSAVVLLGGCQGSGKPRLRCGAFWGSPLGMEFPEPQKLGKHSYGFSLSETNGMLYTCKGGFIDVGHVRESADRTAYLCGITYQNLISGNTEFFFQVIEPSKYRVTLSYPENWDDHSLEEKQAIANEVSVSLGQYLAHTTLIWHEIVTWYGFASAGIFPDTISAFSPEDTYSDLLGTRLAVQALRDDSRQYDEAMTELFARALQELDVQPAHIAHKAARKIDGQWYTGGFYFLVQMKKRNLDVGLDDDYITPWLVPGICPDAVPQSQPVPTGESIRKFGFDFGLELDPKVFEKHKIYHSVGLAADSRVRPEIDFPKIMAAIEKHENGSEMSVAVH
jgi:hypothetical protein